MACSECMALGPPPDAILRMPPPPLPGYLQAMEANLTPPCRMTTRCPTSYIQSDQENTIFASVEYTEMPRQHEAAMSDDDTWFLVLITSCVAFLCIVALLLLFMLKCKEAYNIHFSERSRAKQAVNGDLAGSSCKTGTSEVALYGATTLDSRVLWAALTPRGTRHFIADSYPHEPNGIDENHYECVEPPPYKPLDIYDYDREYEEPLCAYKEAPKYTDDTLSRRFNSRPVVSSPTRIEKPDLPPLNLQNIYAPRTLRKTTHSRRVSDAQQPLDPSSAHLASHFAAI